MARGGGLSRSALAVALAVGLADALRRAVRRVEVAGSSMEPALSAGDRLVVVGLPWGRQPWPGPGAVVAVRDPRHPERILIKRVAAVDRHRDTIDVAGDHPAASTDSRTFGPVPRSSIVGRAVYRYAPAGRSGPGPWLRSTIESNA
jgi:nickel-type superoxide dismutase maturation protease